jgi:type IV pilus assembly protein PilQ
MPVLRQHAVFTSATILGVMLLGDAACRGPAPQPVPRLETVTPVTKDSMKAAIVERAKQYAGRTLTAKPGDPSVPKVTNTWVDTDLKQVLTDIAAQTKVPLLIDPQLQGTVTLSLTDVPLADALERVALPLGLAATPFGDGWLVGAADLKSALFPYLVTTLSYRPQYLRAEELRALLPDAYGQYVKVDNKRNALLVTAPAGLSTRIRSAVQALDQRPKQLVIEALVVDLSRQALNQLGISWEGKYPTTFSGKAAGVLADATGTALTWSGPIGSVQLVSQLKALETNSQARVVASPRILALEGEPAAIFIGTEQYFSFQSGPVNFPFITVEKVPAGIELDLTVSLATDEEIVVDVKKAEASTAVPTSDNRPLVNRRRASTRVRIPNGGTIAIGGLRQRTESQSYQGLPFLARIPFLGALAGSRSWQDSENELVIFLSSATAATADSFLHGGAG